MQKSPIYAWCGVGQGEEERGCYVALGAREEDKAYERMLGTVASETWLRPLEQPSSIYDGWGGVRDKKKKVIKNGCRRGLLTPSDAEIAGGQLVRSESENKKCP
jgi:hypothetical protein